MDSTALAFSIDPSQRPVAQAHRKRRRRSSQVPRAIRFREAVLRGFRAAVAIAFTGDRRTLFLTAIIPAFSSWVQQGNGQRVRKNSLPHLVSLSALIERVEQSILRFDLSLDQVATVLWILCEEVFVSRPAKASSVEPGTDAKVGVMAKRAMGQRDLFADGDTRGMDWLTRFCGIKARKRAEGGLRMDAGCADGAGKGGVGQDVEQEAKHGRTLEGG